MTMDKLYQLAFKFRKAALWKNLRDVDIFALKLSNGEIGYICTMGAGGEHYALALYIGDKGFEDIRDMVFYEPAFDLDLDTGGRFTLFEAHERLLKQDCLQCSFENKWDIEHEEIQTVKAYAKACQEKIASTNGYPLFAKYTSYMIPCDFRTEEEMQLMAEALEAGIALAEILGSGNGGMIGIAPLTEDTKTLLMLEKKGEKYGFAKTPVPKKRKKAYPEPKFNNDIAAAKLKKIKNRPILECEIIRALEPVQENPREIPNFPIAIVMADKTNGFALPSPVYSFYEERAEEIINLVADEFIKNNIYPLKIRVRDERTYRFFKEFGKKAQISVIKTDNLQYIDEIEEMLYDNMRRVGSMDDDEMMKNMEKYLEAILSMGDGIIENAPPEIKNALKQMTESGALSKELTKKIKKQLNADSYAEDVVSEEISKYKTCVLSVSVYKGCYRHIKLPMNITLERLGEEILAAFEFEGIFAHAHAFFMDDKKWSERDCYYIRGVDAAYRSTDEYELNRVGLAVGKKFKFVYDFGDEWVFQCRVLKLLDEETKEPEIIKAVGEPPEQYPDWDGEY